ncbi:hypothetical protein QBC34DRAFT_475977 [Podospora aff. communis PSN243]|uniref:Uncharacterized protein n=1 Tax=Podospora aff. communis PSN243 TaxID=3040156 RepID=A0AAV9G7A6_9PEZI|nr:hypothetical protein QBC34DRAFT_475977 [Podospora aff. communis PSN243]
MAGRAASEAIDLGGIQGLSINQENPSGNPPTIPKEANSYTYSTLAASINIGLSILETPAGRQTLRAIGREVVRLWQDNGSHVFGGDVRQMGAYVDHFLARVRSDFPLVFVMRCNLDTIAYAQRIPGNVLWDGRLDSYLPKGAGSLNFNHHGVAAMTETASQASSPHMRRRFHSYLFKFSVATAHELVHLFTSYLAQGSDSDGSYTPPQLSHLNYGRREGNAVMGESGRWFENSLFGGSLEFYRDPNDDGNQAGVAYLLDGEAVARRVHDSCIQDIAANENLSANFPFRTTGSRYTHQDRRNRNLQSLGSTQGAPAPPAGALLMTALRDRGSLHLYNIPGSQLRRISQAPGRLTNFTEARYTSRVRVR